MDQSVHTSADGSYNAENQTTSHAEFSRQACVWIVQDEYWNMPHNVGNV